MFNRERQRRRMLRDFALKSSYSPNDALPNYVAPENQEVWRQLYNYLVANGSDMARAVRDTNRLYSCGQRSPKAKERHRKVIEARLRRGLSAAGRRRSISFAAVLETKARATLESDSAVTYTTSQNGCSQTDACGKV